VGYKGVLQHELGRYTEWGWAGPFKVEEGNFGPFEGFLPKFEEKEGEKR